MPWLGWACGQCAACRRGDENLCPSARFTGYQLDGGFASEALVDARFALAIPARYGDREAAPLLCAGLIGWRALEAAGSPQRLGLYGFGAAAHIIAQVATIRGQEVLAFVRPAMPQRRNSRYRKGRTGLAVPTRRRRGRSMPRSCSRPSARSCRRPCAPCAPGERSCAPEST